MSRRRMIASARRRASAAAAALVVGQYQGWDQSTAITTWETTNSIAIPLGHEFGDNTQWTYFENGTNFANWETWVNAKAGRRFSYSAPLLTANDDSGLTKAQKYAALAAGTYDVHFTNLGNAFQARPALRNSIVRLGWEFNGTTFPWAVPPNDQATLDNYKTGFNRAAAALKAACPTLQIEWCPNCQLDSTNRTFADMYPGDAYIDYIGIGLYDYYWPGGSPTQAQREAWLRDSVNGLADQVALATARGKRLAHTEWGLWTAGNTGGGGDRPEFIDFIADWYAANNYAYSVYNNVSATAEHRLDTYPLAKARYLARFGGAPVAPTVNAGADATATTGTAFTRTATESNGGSAITSRAWTVVSGPADVGTTIGTAAALSWTPTAAGSYVLRYSATNAVGTGTDDVAITASAPAGTGISFVRETVANSAATTSWALTLSAAATASRTLVAVIGMQAGSTIDFSSVTDNAGNTYTQRANGFLNGSNTRIAIYDCINLTGAPTVLTVTPTASAQMRATVTEWSGVGSFDVATAVGVAASTAPAAPAITTTAPNELVVAGVNFGSATTTASEALTGFTTRGPATSAGGRMYSADSLVAAAGSASVPWTLSSSVATGQAIAAYKPAASAPVAPTLQQFAASAFNDTATPKTVSLTVAVGDVLVVSGIASDSTATLTTPTGGTGFTWMLQQSSLVAGTDSLYVWTATATAAQTFTLSVARTGAVKNWGTYAKVWRGSTGVGASAKATGTGGPSLALTTTGSASIIDATWGDWSNTATVPTYRTAGVGAFTQQAFNPVGTAGGNYTSVTGYYGSPGTAGAKTIGASAPSYTYAIAAVEILGT